MSAFKNIIIITTLFSSLSAFSELREYNNLKSLSDEESNEITIDLKINDKSLTAPSSDFISTHNEQTGKLLNACKAAKAQLVFMNDQKNFFDKCNKAIKGGAADAGFIIGSTLTNGEWMAPDLTQAINLLESSAKDGSRLAKRALIQYYTNPNMPLNNNQKALNLAKELELTQENWDIYIAASMRASFGNKDEAIEGFETLSKLASEGFKQAAISAALSRIKQGPLHDIHLAKALFETADLQTDVNYSFLPVLIDIVENNYIGARDKLKECHKLNSTCSFLYFNFISKGIGGLQDLEYANNLLEKSFNKWPETTANNYAWNKATFKSKPIYDPRAALNAVNKIPNYKKSLPYIKDTIAAVYAANNDFTQAKKIQREVVRELKGKGLDKQVAEMKTRLNHYQNEKRWIEPLKTKIFLSNVKGFSNVNDTQLELTSL